MARLLPLSKGCQYAIRTAASLTFEPLGTVFPRREVSWRTQIPYAFVSKILQSLTRNGLLSSHRGAQRDFPFGRGDRLRRPPGARGLLLGRLQALSGGACLPHSPPAYGRAEKNDRKPLFRFRGGPDTFYPPGNGYYKLAEPV